MSSKDRPIFVVDTNILVDYVDVIPGEGRNAPRQPTIDLSESHLVIPTVVIRELSNFKNEKSDRGKAARTVLRRLRDLFGVDPQTMEASYRLQAPITARDGKQLISIMPLHRDFWRCLPFKPDNRDMDGQIVLTALATSMATRGLPVDGSVDLLGPHPESMTFENVTLLTNDHGMMLRAYVRGVPTQEYKYEHPALYTGRREIVATPELFREFINSAGKGVTREYFEEQMPDEPPLVANEFVIMGLNGSQDLPAGYRPDEEDAFFRHIGRYDKRLDSIVPLQYVSSFPTAVRNPGQAIYAEALMNPDIAAVVCVGPAGSGKTYMATIYGYEACREGKFIGVTVVPCENRSNIGASPGDLDEKMDPDVQPLKNALRNFLLRNDKKLSQELTALRAHGPEKAAAKKGKSKKNNAKENDDPSMDAAGQESGKRSLKARLGDRVDLIWDNWFSSVPIESARGRDFAYELAIYDEFQDQNFTQADTLIKRLGADGKIVLTGDVNQIHAPYLDRDNNGLVYASELLQNNPMVAQVQFTEDEVVRHPLVKEIARRQSADTGADANTAE